MGEEWPVRVFKGELAVIFQIIMFKSAEPEANKPLGSRLNVNKLLEWPFRVFKHSPETKNQIFIIYF
jgi:hypothetical protein